MFPERAKTECRTVDLEHRSDEAIGPDVGKRTSGDDLTTCIDQPLLDFGQHGARSQRPQLIKLAEVSTLVRAKRVLEPEDVLDIDGPTGTNHPNRLCEETISRRAVAAGLKEQRSIK